MIRRTITITTGIVIAAHIPLICRGISTLVQLRDSSMFNGAEAAAVINQIIASIDSPAPTSDIFNA